MAQWLTKYINKKCHAHSDTHSITWPHYSTTISTKVVVKLVPTGVPLLLTFYNIAHLYKIISTCIRTYCSHAVVQLHVQLTYVTNDILVSISNLNSH